MMLRPYPETRHVTLAYFGGPMDGRVDSPVETPLGQIRVKGGTYQLVGFQTPKDYLGENARPSPFQCDRAVYQWEVMPCSAK